MAFDWRPFPELLSEIVDNRGRTCPVGEVGLPLIATNCIKPDRLFPVYETDRYVSQHTYDHWFRGHPLPGDILFVCKGSPGRTSWVPDPVDFCIAQDMVAVRPNPDRVYAKYLLAALRSQSVQHQIATMHVGTLIPHFKKGDFGKLLIPVPDDATQQLIGDFYFALSLRIEHNRALAANLEAIARALFKSWFVDFDPVRAKAAGEAPPGLAPDLAALFPDRFVDSELGEIPEGWNAATLAGVCSLNPEAWTRRKHPEKVEYVDLANVKAGEIENRALYSWDESPSRARRVLRPGDTIVGTVRPGNRSFALIVEDGLTGSTGFAVLRPNSEWLREFVYLAATSDDAIDRLTHLADGAAYPAVRPDVVVATEAVIPSEDVVKEFSAILRPLIDRVAASRSESAALTQLRDLLLPRLISGKLRVEDAEAALEAA